MPETMITVNTAEVRRPSRVEGWVTPKWPTFEAVLFSAAFIVILAGAYESVTEAVFPAFSILSFLHSLGLLKGLPVVYEPGKGIWLLMGWTGSVMMTVMMVYSARKRLGIMRDRGAMRSWLNLHMFLGITGPILVLFHTTFKFGGLVATSFWCMVVTVVFGIAGRYIYLQIPRSITGAELGEKELEDEIKGLEKELSRAFEPRKDPGLPSEPSLLSLLQRMEYEGPADDGHAGTFVSIIRTDIGNMFRARALGRLLVRDYRLSSAQGGHVLALLKKKASLSRKRRLLAASQRLLRFWHVLHIPLAIVMFLIMAFHIAVHFLFRT